MKSAYLILLKSSNVVIGLITDLSSFIQRHYTRFNGQSEVFDASK